jgi:hypothetical protein
LLNARHRHHGVSAVRSVCTDEMRRLVAAVSAAGPRVQPLLTAQVIAHCSNLRFVIHPSCVGNECTHVQQRAHSHSSTHTRSSAHTHTHTAPLSRDGAPRSTNTAFAPQPQSMACCVDLPTRRATYAPQPCCFQVRGVMGEFCFSRVLAVLGRCKCGAHT